MLRRLIRLNIEVSDRLMPAVHVSSHAQNEYLVALRKLVAEPGPKTMLDVGAGRSWHLDPAEKPPHLRLIGLDVSASEMQGNTALDARIVGDASSGLPLRDASVDVVTARSVIEHLPNNDVFLRSAFDALRRNGRLLVVFPNRYAPFAILNQLLPRRVSRLLLRHLWPGSDGVQGFTAHYHRCGARAFRRALQRAGFEIEREYQSYFASSYFRFFVPLYLLSLAMDYLRYWLGIKTLSAYNLFVASKP